MRLDQLRIQQFRCFSDRTLHLGDYTCLVGPGGAGKSAILTALRILFRDPTDAPTDLLRLAAADFHRNDTTKDIVITATFSNLEEEAKTDFKHYVRQNHLVISAVAKWNNESGYAEVKQFGERMVMTAFKGFFAAEDQSAKNLTSIYSALRGSHNLPAPGTKQAMTEALRHFEEDHPDQCTLERSEDQFYGVSKGANLLQKYIQWVFVPAVKDASTEQTEGKKTALGSLLDRTVRTRMSFAEPLAELKRELGEKYRELVERNQGALDDLSRVLGERLREWASPDARLALSWRNDPSRSITISEPLAEIAAGDTRFQGPLARCGHGLQRSFLLALLQELSGCADAGTPTLLLACEEPELYQHPPQARHLSSVLQKLSKQNSQIIVASHSPYFISAQGFEDVRIVRQELAEDQSCVRSVRLEELCNKVTEAFGEDIPKPAWTKFKLEQALRPGLNEMFFAWVVVLVEGMEDMAYLSAHLELTGKTEEFRRLGCHIVPTMGKGPMVQLLSIAKLFEIPTFTIFDADGDDQGPSTERLNRALLRLCSAGGAAPFPGAIFQTNELVMWPVDIGRTLQEEIGCGEWTRFTNTVKEMHNLRGMKNLEKNALFIGHALAEAYGNGKTSAILNNLCNQILSFADTARVRRV